MSDPTTPEQNLAHIPVSDDPTPVNTHTVATPRESVAPHENSAGASPFSPAMPPRFEPVKNPEDNYPCIRHLHPGEPNPVPGGPSGCVIRSFSPTGVHDTTGKD